MPLRVCTGFEHGISDATSLVKGNATNKYIDIVTGTPTMVSSGSVRSGTYCCELNPAASTEYIRWAADTLIASQNRIVAHFAFMFPSSLPSADVDFMNVICSTNGCSIRFRNSDDKLVARAGDGTADLVGPTIVADTWYDVEFSYDCSANPRTIAWQVDGINQTGGNNAVASATINHITFGHTGTTQTYTLRLDNVLVWTDTAAISTYPHGPHKVELLKPDTGGTTAEIGTANATARFTANGTIDSTHNSANILAALSELPPTIGASANGVAQRTSGTGNAVGVPMTTYTLQSGESITGLRILIVGWSGSATTNLIGMRTFNGSTETTLFAAADPNFDADTTSPAWLCKMATVADFNTQSELDALVVRLGYSNDIAPNPGAHAIYAEVAIKEAVGIDLIIDSLTQAQTLENIAFTQTHELVIAALTQAQTLDNIVFTQLHELVIAALTQAQELENVTIAAGSIDLVIADLTQAQTLDNLTITQVHQLVINALTQAQTLDNVTITQVHNLVINALTQAQTLDNVTITQVHNLVIDAITQAQTLDNLTVNSAINLVINALTQAQTLDNLSLTQVHQLTIDALTQAQALDNLTLTQLHQLAIANLTQGQILSNVVVESVGALRPTIDVVAVALLRVLTGIPATRVDTTLPKDTIVWADGFVQAVGISEQSGMYVPLHSSVIAVSCWATNVGSGKPPWGKANQLAEGIKVACLDHDNFPVTLDLSSFGAYTSARVHSAYFINEPHRIPSDEGSYARYDGDLQVHWVPL
jgi:hypothetical protein